jgi:hypothetical protein
MANIQSVVFPVRSSVHLIAIALLANGLSSYRDASSIARISIMKWKARVTIITDRPDKLTLGPLRPSIEVCGVQNARELLSTIDSCVAKLPKVSSLLFTISAHGYNTIVPERVAMEMNGCSDYIMVGNEKVFDHQLFEALYGKMSDGIDSLCLIDTCHSGTMLDLEYLSSDGKLFSRSKLAAKPRPFSVCISACNDQELAGEDISDYGGWGGKLGCQFMDYLQRTSSRTFRVLEFYMHIWRIFTSQVSQSSHPIISYND